MISQFLSLHEKTWSRVPSCWRHENTNLASSFFWWFEGDWSTSYTYHVKGGECILFTIAPDSFSKTVPFCHDRTIKALYSSIFLFAMPSSSSSSTSSSDGEAPPQPEKIVCDGTSSENDDEKEVNVSHRSWVMMWSDAKGIHEEFWGQTATSTTYSSRSWPRADGWAAQSSFGKNGMKTALREMIVVCEPRRKYQPDGKRPEVHDHIVFKMRNYFAHKRIDVCE